MDEARGIPTATTAIADLGIKLVDERGDRKPSLQPARFLQAHAKVLAHPLHREAKLELAAAHRRTTIVHLPALRGAFADYVHHTLHIEAYSNPPANYYRALRDPFSRAEATAQVFCGVRLQCAKCHNHPFDRWTQNDFYSWANLFARVDYKIVENNRRDDNDKHEFVGEQIVFSPGKGEVDDPRTKSPRDPQFLLAEQALPRDDDRLAGLGQQFAQLGQ